jgi:predicted metal-dependent HD superfamily phosphohydrolase
MAMVLQRMGFGISLILLFLSFFSSFLLFLHDMQLLIPPDLAVLYRIWFHFAARKDNEERSAASTLAGLVSTLHWSLHRGRSDCP